MAIAYQQPQAVDPLQLKNSYGGSVYNDAQSKASLNNFTPQKLNPANYGVNYDYNSIKGIFDNATKTQYQTLRDQYDQTANQFYNNQFNNQQTALDTIRKSNASAVATGASRGMQAANELSSTLGLQQQGTQEATTLAGNRSGLADKEQAAYAQNSSNALTAANTAGENLYSADTQWGVGQMNYYAALESAYKQLQAAQETAAGTRYYAGATADASRYTADSNKNAAYYAANIGAQAQTQVADTNLIGTKYTADQNLTGTKYNADKNYAGTIGAANINSSATRAAAATSADATRYAANTSAAAQKATSSASKADISSLLSKYSSSGDQASYVSTLMNYSNMSKADATAYWHSTRSQNVQLPVSFPPQINNTLSAPKLQDNGPGWQLRQALGLK